MMFNFEFFPQNKTQVVLFYLRKILFDCSFFNDFPK